ncbi:hypothetical protein K438DRAFT_1810805 [Mycena galopus ATCC 62051]|nr:hypothetical protein K438DRAFT_1810805 [Mycena galopus ATCC 62051]
MSDHSLPDEIISEILSPALKVSDELFCHNGFVSPFAKYSESTSAYLLVCKSWLRVATPLLYNIVVLRSKAQAKALSVALSGNGELGQFIKKLRVEGGYGPPMHIILKCSPNISDLFLSLQIYSSDNTNGLCKGLPLINPTRLILQDVSYKPLENKVISQLSEALIKSISKWDRLRAFDSPYIYGRTDRAEKVIQALAKSKKLCTFGIPSINSLSWTYSLLKECPLKSINIKEPLSLRDTELRDLDPAVRALLKFTEVPVVGRARAQEPISELPLIPPSLNPFFVPMAGAPKEVQDTVWARVLYFAMSVPELDNNSASKDVPRRLPLLLVSKTFNRLGLLSYYAHVAIRQSSALIKFASVLSTNSSIGPQVRSLAVEHGDYDYDTSDSEAEDADFNSSNVVLNKVDSTIYSTIFSQTTGLVRLSQATGDYSLSILWSPSAAIPWDAFEGVAQSSGSTLREFSVRMETKEQTSGIILSNFTALRTLRWNCSTSFLLTNIPEDGLQNLEELKISSASQSFLTVLSLMKLKSLKRVVLFRNDSDLEPFFKAHGHKLTEITLPFCELETLTFKIFELCPNLCSISLFGHAGLGKPPTADSLKSRQAVPSLVKIKFDMPYWTRNKAQIAAWEDLFLKFDPKCLPNLREFEVKCCEWPTNERDIPKNCWVRWAEALLKHGISLMDEAGTKWRPRLKVR